MLVHAGAKLLLHAGHDRSINELPGFGKGKNPYEGFSPHRQTV